MTQEDRLAYWALAKLRQDRPEDFKKAAKVFSVELCTCCGYIKKQCFCPYVGVTNE